MIRKRLKHKIYKLTTLDIELAVSSFLNLRANLIVPNVSWGFDIHGGYGECDLLVTTSSRYLWEVEIKISKYDLIKDKEKYHKHYDKRIRRLYFAIPDYLKDQIEHIPERAGIIIIDSKRYFQYKLNNRSIRSYKYLCDLIREPKQSVGKQITNKEYIKIAHLGAMRIWGLKSKLQKKISKTKSIKIGGLK